ncbi:porin family protein [Flavobacterium sp.]|uniref:porin family protein n=1 Tax=Flavobacterium sp. TaxID=239 RepID=UPI00286B7DA3|nr:porin family protein [Flavobacterium sp.]
MQNFFKIIIFLTFLNSFSQDIPNFSEIDSLYREDQFYLNLTYNILRDKSAGISQNSLSSGVNFGFLRDFPINKSRTVSIAPGLGLSFNNYKQNLIIQNGGNTVQYSLIEPNFPYNKNKLTMYFVELPIEFRWRTSTYESHKFWRIYTGLKFSYLLNSRSKFISPTQNFIVNNNPDINKFQYGVYLTSGWNSWNIYAYYGLQDIFKNGNLNNDSLKLNTFNIGLMFYIL